MKCGWTNCVLKCYKPHHRHANDHRKEPTVTKMNQDRTDYGEKGESGEKMPSGSSKADHSGERKESITGGVAMGKADKITGREEGHAGKHDGNVGEFKGDSHGEKHVYRHRKPEYRPGKY